MEDLQQLYVGCAQLLRRLREDTGTTRERMALILNVDTKTYRRYESGEAAPKVPEFISLYAELGKDALRSVLDMIYPDIYQGLTAESSPEELRRATVHYFQHIASDHEIREMNYLIFGEDGSNWKPKLEKYTKESHLSLKSRIIIGSLIDELYELDATDGTLVGMEHVIQDEELIRQTTKKALEAFQNGRTTYTTVIV